MPTPLRNIRVDDDLWAAFKKRAHEEGRDASSLIRELMLAHLDK